MLDRTGYPPGVPCWIDLVQPDHDATAAFYGGLFGWDFEVRTPEGAPFTYAYARIDGKTVAGVGTPPPGEESPAGWISYVGVESADRTAAVIEANGGRILSPPADIPGAGRVAVGADPDGAVFGVWQPAENRGAELVNAFGAWNFSGLHTATPDRAETFYGAVFGWVFNPFDMGDGQQTGIWRVLGYGDFLAARDPEIRERQAEDQAPDGFSDAVATMQVDEAGGARAGAHWDITFAVEDADAAVARAVELGATVVTPPFDTTYTRQAVVRDPQGAEIGLSQYRPPSAD